MIAVIICGALSKMNDECDLERGHVGSHYCEDEWGGQVEWFVDHTFPCDCGNCHNSQPAVAEKAGD